MWSSHGNEISLSSFLNGEWSPSQAHYGLLPMLVGSLCVAGPASLLSFFWALGISTFSYIAPKTFRHLLSFLIRSMASIPSILFALGGVLFVVPLVRFYSGTSGYSLAATILSLSFFLLPFQFKLLDACFRTSSEAIGIGPDVLGFTNLQKMIWVVFPQAKLGLLSSAALGLCRSLGDTMIALLVSGNSPQIPNSMFSPVRTLTAHIALVAGTDSFSPMFQSLLVSIAILMSLTAGFNLLIVNVFGPDRQFLSRKKVWKKPIPTVSPKSDVLEKKIFKIFPCPPLHKIRFPTKIRFFSPDLLEKSVEAASLFCFLLFMFLACSFLFLLLQNGLHAFSVLFAMKESTLPRLLPAVLGTMSVVLLTLVIAGPLGVIIGIWSSFFASSLFKKILDIHIHILSSTPSIVIGFLGYFFILFVRQKFGLQARPCLLLSAVCLSFLVLPVLIRSTEHAIQQVPDKEKFSGLHLGFTPLQNAFYVVLPHARQGISHGVYLATVRAAEDTAVIMLTGAVADSILPTGLSEPFSSLSLQILYGITEHRGAQDQLFVFATSLVLISMTFTLSFLGEFFTKGKRHGR